jgi:hypothetical protein
VTLCGAKLAAIAASETDFQVRSYPKSFEGNVLQAGFEVVRGLDLVRSRAGARRRSARPARRRDSSRRVGAR